MSVQIRPAREDDRIAVARQFAAVAEERDRIAGELWDAIDVGLLL